MKRKLKSERAKYKYMLGLKLKQLQYETDTWKRQLSFMIEENVHLKNRLSEILSDRFNRRLLDQVEGFQNRFVKEDEVLYLLRIEVAELEKLLVRELFEDGRTPRKVQNRIEKLRNGIKKLENEFSRLKVEFNSYLAENIG